MGELISERAIQRVLLAFLFLTHVIGAGQESPPRSVRDGWAIHIGAGIMYGGNIGLLTERQIQLNERLRISPFVSAGIGEAGTDSVSSKKYYWVGYAAGANLEYGKKHRIILGPHFEGNNLLESSDEVKKNFFSGFSIILGYKGTAGFGLIWQVYIGDFYSPDDNPFSSEKKYEHRSQVGLGLGYKF